MFTREGSGVENNKCTECPLSLEAQPSNNNYVFILYVLYPSHLTNACMCPGGSWTLAFQHWPFRFLDSFYRHTRESSCFLIILHWPFRLEEKVMALTQQVFSWMLEPRSLLSQLDKIRDWQLPWDPLIERGVGLSPSEKAMLEAKEL